MKSAYFLSIFFLKVTKTFAEYYKSVTKINCYVGKSFVSQFIVDSYGIGKFLQIKRNMNKKKAYGK